MSILQSVRALVVKDLLIEFRNKYVLGGVGLYVLSSVLVIYFSLNYNNSLKGIDPVVWSILFWLIVLFSCINAIANSFFRESEGRVYYYYYVASPQSIIIAKTIYNFVFTLLLIIVAYLVFSLLIGHPVTNPALFLLTAILGGTGYSFLFTLMGAIASRAGNSASLIAILGFPIIIPLIIFITRLSAAAISDTAISVEAWNNAGFLGAFDLIELILGYILFPYIWRD